MVNAVFPLPKNYFPPMRLSDKEARAYQSWGDSLLEDTINAYERFQFETQEQKERGWKVLKQRGDLTAYRRRHPDDSDSDDYRYLCTGRIDGTLDEVMYGRYADNTDDFRRMSAVYREDLVDCAVLHVIERQSPVNPYFFSGFKWMTVQSLGKGLVKNRDVCWYEQSGLTVDRNGKEIGYTITESVDLPICPPFSSSYCVRAKLSVCYLYKRNKSGGVKVYMRGRNNAGGRVMDWVADLKSAELWLRIERATACAHAGIATELVKVTTGCPRPLRRSKGRCDVCREKSSGMLASEKECAVCHRMTCARCVVKKRVLSSDADFRQSRKEYFCKKCLHLIHDVNLRDPHGVEEVCAMAISESRSIEHSHHSSGNRSFRGSSTGRSTDGSQADTARRPDRSHGHPPPPAPMSSSASCPAVSVALYSDTPDLRRVKSLDVGVKREEHFPADVHAMPMPTTTKSSTSTNSFVSEVSFASRSSGASTGSHDLESFKNHPSQGGDLHPTTMTSAHVAPLPLHPPAAPQPADNGPESLMAQMMRMNMMAEKARMLVQENNKLARQFQ
ncbi:TPA: hypothetical protein N0F65_007366 [Lagenidium giganteum]|uniref:FYVE-type domain-containing protein n=1 Tax=Lagenidium giganteum TaxID=4803 RepID=A0AAV2YEY1_9STRA|nr:TPA: hypothetical protein N0F65_007366 [Lagenidium giganteum]